MSKMYKARNGEGWWYNKPRRRFLEKHEGTTFFTRENLLWELNYAVKWYNADPNDIYIVVFDLVEVEIERPDFSGLQKSEESGETFEEIV